MSGRRTCGSSSGRSRELDRNLGADGGPDAFGELQHGHLLGVAEVHGSGEVGDEQPPESLHEIVDVAQRARLAPVAVNRDRLAPQRLRDEGRHGATVVAAHPRPVRVEDARDRHRDGVDAVVRHRHGLGESLRLVVDAAGADGVDVAPVGLGLRVHQWIAVGLRRGRQHELRARGLGQTERVQRPERAHLERVDGVVEVVPRRRRRARGARPRRWRPPR